LGVIESGDPNEDPLTYTWTQTEGTPVTLEDATTETPSFVPEQPGIYTFELDVFDGELHSNPEQVQVVVDGENHHPTADAGQDLTAKVGETVTLSGSGSSDLDGDPLSYAWTQTDGTPVDLRGANSQTPSLMAELPGVYVFELVVNDGSLSSPGDDVRVSIEPLDNHEPVAIIAAMEKPVYGGQWTTLDGSGSFDPDGHALTFLWTQTAGPAVKLETADQPVTGFYAVTEGTPQFELVVNDGELSSAPGRVDVTVLPLEAVEPPSQTRLSEKSASHSQGCSVGRGGNAQHKVVATDVGYVLTLFLPAIGAGWYQKRRLRRPGKQMPLP
jgi:hypothetical protein